MSTAPPLTEHHAHHGSAPSAGASSAPEPWVCERLANVRVLVTGGAGYVGSAVAQHLARAGARVSLFDDLSTGHRHAARGLPLFVGDVRDEEALRRALRESGAQAVCHLAALANIPESFADPERCDAVNHGGTRALLAAMRENDVKALAFASTCAVYAAPAPGAVLCEGDREDPASPYARSKQRAEGAIREAMDASNVRAVCFRFFNAAGADRAAGVGEEHAHETHVIPRLLRWARGKGDFALYGDDYPTRDGSCVRDYVHVTDLADAHARALARLIAEPDAPTGVCNLGSAVGTSVRELVAEVRALLRCARTLAVHPRRDGDTPQLLADTSRARAWFGWQARHSLASVLDDALWWERHLEERPQ